MVPFVPLKCVFVHFACDFGSKSLICEYIGSRIKQKGRVQNKMLLQDVAAILMF